MKHFHLAAICLTMLFASFARGGENIQREFTVTKLDGWFSTYSIPAADTKMQFDLTALTKPQKDGKIDFKHADADRQWYFPYEGSWRLVADKTTESSPHIPAMRAVRLMNESRTHRTTMTLHFFIEKDKTTCRGFFVFEEIDGPVLGIFSFH